MTNFPIFTGGFRLSYKGETCINNDGRGTEQSHPMSALGHFHGSLYFCSWHHFTRPQTPKQHIQNCKGWPLRWEPRLEKRGKENVSELLALFWWKGESASPKFTNDQGKQEASHLWLSTPFTNNAVAGQGEGPKASSSPYFETLNRGLAPRDFIAWGEASWAFECGPPTYLKLCIGHCNEKNIWT